MLTSTRLFHVTLPLLAVLLLWQAEAAANNLYNPKSQVEYISLQPGREKPLVVPITQPPLLDLTPPPPPGDSTNFAYNPKSKTWTKLTGHEPQTAEDTLTWNQANDKWLTNTPGK